MLPPPTLGPENTYASNHCRDTVIDFNSPSFSYEKCKRCHSQLMAIRSMAGSNAKLGRHASANREVGVLMQLFDASV